MNWKIEFEPLADKELKKLNKNTQKDIVQYLYKKVIKSNHPKDFITFLYRY